jgi:hypothetical protein
LNNQTNQHENNQDDRVRDRRAILYQHEKEHGRNDNDRDCAKFAAEVGCRLDQLSKAMAILPDAAANGDQADANPDIGQDIKRALHRVGDSKIGVLSLVQIADEKNAAKKANDLHDCLDESEITHDARTIESAAKVLEIIEWQ